jgi:threonyl-tRNA synthetase
MIHRVVLGAIERFIGVLIEHYAGAFPLWLAPVQVVIMTITDRQDAYAEAIAQKLKDQGVRLEADLRNEKIGFKIREARNQKIPYMIVIGDKEMETGTIAVRKRGQDLTKNYSLEEFIAQFRDEVDKRV